MKLFYKTYQNLLIVAAFIFISESAVAQKDYDNSIKFSFTNFIFPGLQYQGVDPILADQIGIYFEHRIKKNWGVMAGYSMFNIYETDGLSPLESSEPSVFNGLGTTRHNYKMVDLLWVYTLNVRKRHKISFDIGPSYTWGKNYNYVYGLSFFPTTTNDFNASYWGIVPAIGYDFIFLRKILDIGLDLRCRKYFNWPSEQIDYGLHLGVNF